MYRLCVIALCLTTLPACSLLRPTKPEPIDRPVIQPLACLDTALEKCEGVPQREYTDGQQIVLGLGEALRALRECQDRHNELRGCVSSHNAQAKKSPD
jgi:hypothetical protein